MKWFHSRKSRLSFRGVRLRCPKECVPIWEVTQRSQESRDTKMSRNNVCDSRVQEIAHTSAKRRNFLVRMAFFSTNTLTVQNTHHGPLSGVHCIRGVSSCPLTPSISSFLRPWSSHGCAGMLLSVLTYSYLSFLHAEKLSQRLCEHQRHGRNVWKAVSHNTVRTR